MNLKKNYNLTHKIWLYLILFSITILTFLWFFQVIFLNTYYEYVKIKDIYKIANQLRKNYESENFQDIIDHITFDNGVCIEIIQSGDPFYSSNSYNRGCLESSNSVVSYPYKKEFIMSGEESKSYKIVNQRFHNKTLVHALKLNAETFVFINVSLEPLGWATNILAQQLIYVTIGVLVLSLLIGYFISKRISKPIISLNKSAENLAKRNFDTSFETKTDIKELNQLAVTLNHAKKELAKTEELRRDLMANVSHDLKTPLTMIKAYAEMVRDLSYNNEEKRNSHLNTIIEETDRLNLLVNDILELSKMQSGVEELNIETFDIHMLMTTILQKFSYLKEKENYQLIYDNPKSITVKADKKRIEQVLYNLISNAITHIGKDKIIILQIIEKESTIRIEVIDHGKGISKENQLLVWDRYYKIDKNHKRESNSTGIGLSIVKSIMEQHKMPYGISSEHGKGTTFYIELEKA